MSWRVRQSDKMKSLQQQYSYSGHKLTSSMIASTVGMTAAAKRWISCSISLVHFLPFKRTGK
eukprot:808623-Heterocapsa_arctica.AAC.2